LIALYRDPDNGPLNCGWQGTLDILIQRTGLEGQGKITFVQNNFYYDAFFLKAIGELSLAVFCVLGTQPQPDITVLNGACDNGWCETPNRTHRYQVSLLLAFGINS
jgi:integrin alpha FG-GAP repeat containing protein 1